MGIDSLIQNVQNNCDTLTNFCIEVLSHISKELGISYGELNVCLFLVIYPLVLILFIIASLAGNQRLKKILIISGFTIIGVVLFIGAFFTLEAMAVTKFGN